MVSDCLLLCNRSLPPRAGSLGSPSHTATFYNRQQLGGYEILVPYTRVLATAGTRSHTHTHVHYVRATRYASVKKVVQRWPAQHCQIHRSQYRGCGNIPYRPAPSRGFAGDKKLGTNAHRYGTHPFPITSSHGPHSECTGRVPLLSAPYACAPPCDSTAMVE